MEDVMALPRFHLTQPVNRKKFYCFNELVGRLTTPHSECENVMRLSPKYTCPSSSCAVLRNSSGLVKMTYLHPLRGKLQYSVHGNLSFLCWSWWVSEIVICRFGTPDYLFWFLLAGTLLRKLHQRYDMPPQWKFESKEIIQEQVARALQAFVDSKQDSLKGVWNNYKSFLLLHWAGELIDIHSIGLYDV